MIKTPTTMDEDTGVSGSPFKPAICGALAGIVSRLGTAPLDLLKIRLQVWTRLKGITFHRCNDIPKHMHY